MQRSLFRKYFSVCCSIVLMSIVVLGIIFMDNPFVVGCI